MNLVLQSDTIDLGTPWSLMTSFRNSHTTSFAVTHIVVGTRCTVGNKTVQMFGSFGLCIEYIF